MHAGMGGMPGMFGGMGAVPEHSLPQFWHMQKAF
jgi:hypothetical protein